MLNFYIYLIFWCWVTFDLGLIFDTLLTFLFVTNIFIAGCEYSVLLTFFVHSLYLELSWHFGVKLTFWSLTDILKFAKYLFCVTWQGAIDKTHRQHPRNQTSFTSIYSSPYINTTCTNKHSMSSDHKHHF